MAFSKLGALIERVNSTVTSAGTLTLANNSASFQRFTGSTTHTVVLPQANAASPSECPLGLKFVILNRSSGDVTVQTFGGAALATVAAGNQKTFRLTDNSSSTGSWDITVEAGGAASLSDAEKAIVLAGLGTNKYSDSSTETKAIKLALESQGGNVWITRNDLPSARAHLASFTASGGMYTGNGRAAGGGLTDYWRYRQDLNLWETSTPSNVGRTEPGVTQTALKGYVVGGSSVASSESFDPATNVWTTLANMSATRQAAMTAYYNDGLFIFGGFLAGGGPTATGLRYDIPLNVYYSRASLPNVLASATRLVGPRRLHILGGYNGSSAVSATQAYDDALDTFVVTTSLPANRYYSASFVSSGAGYMISGYDGSAIASSLKINFETNVYETTANIPVPKFDMTSGGVSLNGSGYTPGGTAVGPQVATVYEYIPFSYASALTKSTSNAATTIIAAATIDKVAALLPIRVRSDGDRWSRFNSGDLIQDETAAPMGTVELVTNGTFGSNITGWSQSGGLTAVWSGGQAQLTRTGANGAFYQTINTVAGQKYRISWDMTSTTNSGGSFEFWAVDGTNPTSGTILYDVAADSKYASNNFAVRTYSATFTALSTQTTLRFYLESVASWTATLDNVTVKTAGHRTFSMQKYMGASPYAYYAGGVGSVTNYRYDELRDIWLTRAPLSGSQIASAGRFSLNGYGYVSGYDDGVGIVNNTWRYDDTNDVWLSKAALIVASSGNGGFALEGKGHIVGGSTISLGFITNNSQYDDVLDSWVAKMNLTTGTTTHGSAASAEVGWVGGGVNSGTRIANTATYDGVNDNWTRTQNFQSGSGARNDVGGVSVDGDIYALGGQDNGPTNLQACDRFSLTTGVWTARTSFATPRRGLNGCASRIDDKIYATAGYTASPTNIHDQFTPEANTWITKNGLTINVYSGAALQPGFNRKYEVQIGTASFMSALGSLQWRTITSMQNVRANHGLTNADGSSMAFSGGSSNNTCETYSDGVNAWRYTGTHPLATQIGAFGLNGRAYSVSNGSNASNVVYVFNSENGNWVSRTGLQTGRSRFSQGNCTALNGFGYATGGDDTGSGYYTSTEQYNQALDTWSYVASNNTTNQSRTPLGFNVEGFWLIAGGYGPTFPANNNFVQIYNDAGNTWTTKNTYPVNQIGGSGIQVNGNSYGAGGYNGVDIANVYRYNFSLDTWTTSTSMPIITAGHQHDATRGIVSGGDNNGVNNIATAYKVSDTIKNIVLGAGLKVT